MYKKLSKTREAVNEVRVDSIKEVLYKLQRIINDTPKDNAFKIEENEKIIDIVERILYFNQLNQAWKDLNILTPSQMLSRLPISLAQLKAGNNSEKLKNEIRQLLYSLYRSKKLTRNIYKSLIDIIWRQMSLSNLFISLLANLIKPQITKILDGSYSISDIQDYF